MLFFFLFYTSLMVHPIHVSVSEVEITSDEMIWNIRIYKDDLLLDMYGKDINMDVLDNEQKVRKDILAYFTKNVTVLHNGSKLKWTLTDLQPDPEAIWISANAPLTSRSNLTIQNRVLLDVYSDQKNVVNFEWSSGKKNFVFEKGRDKEVLKLN